MSYWNADKIGSVDKHIAHYDKTCHFQFARFGDEIEITKAFYTSVHAKLMSNGKIGRALRFNNIDLSNCTEEEMDCVYEKASCA